MRLTRITAASILSFRDIDLGLDDALTVIAGPNGSGKTNIGRLVDIVRLAVQAATGPHWDGSRVTVEYGAAGRFNAPYWSVLLGIVFDDPSETRLIQDWARGCLYRIDSPNISNYALTPGMFDYDVGALPLLTNGAIHVSHDHARTSPWQIKWVTKTDHGSYELDLWNGCTLRRTDTSDESPHASQVQPVDMQLRERFDQIAATMRGQMVAPVAEPTLATLAATGNLDLDLRATNQIAEPPETRRILDALAVTSNTSVTPVRFAHVLDHLLGRRLITTSNLRAPARTDYTNDELALEPDLNTGADLALALYQDKTGDAGRRARFRKTQDVFRTVTDSELNLVAERLDEHRTLLVPILEETNPDTGQPADIPLRLGGAGREEAAYLALLLARDPDVLVLDEPGTNLSPTAQRRILTELRVRNAGGRQTILITHSGDLVPMNTPTEVMGITRLTRGQAATVAHRIPPTAAFEEIAKTLRTTQLRRLVFANGVFLVEGDSETEALDVWLATPGHGLPTPEQANVAIISVNGHKSFAPWTAILDALGIPWAILADGPAFRASLDKIKNRAARGMPNETFQDAIARWNPHGVYTLAKDFGDSGDKAGEIEAYFANTAPREWAAVQSPGRPKKIKEARAFAALVPTPAEISHIWAKVIEHLSGP